MIINWYGEGCFKLQEGETTILIDPIEGSSGLSAPRFKPTILVKTLMPTPTAESEKEPAINEDGSAVIVGPGEYEAKGVSITGWTLQKDSSDAFIKSVFRIKTDDLVIGVLGHLSEFNEPEILEEMGNIDVLIIPGGGKPFIECAAAAKLIRQINPKLVIPSFFKVPGLKRKAEDVSEFLKEMGQKVEAEEKVNVKKKELTDPKTKVVVLKV